MRLSTSIPPITGTTSSCSFPDPTIATVGGTMIGVANFPSNVPKLYRKAGAYRLHAGLPARTGCAQVEELEERADAECPREGREERVAGEHRAGLPAGHIEEMRAHVETEQAREEWQAAGLDAGVEQPLRDPAGCGRYGRQLCEGPHLAHELRVIC